MGILVECAKDGVSNKNTGAKEQCLEGVTIRHALATDEQEFATVASFKTLADWKTDRDLKKIIPLYAIEELATADTEDTYFEGNSRYLTKTGKKIRTFNCMLGLCSHNALKSYNGKKMRVYEFTDAQEIKGVSVDDVKVRGQLVTITVGKRIDALADKPAYTPVTLQYEDYNEFEDNGVIVKPTWSNIELDGIFDVSIELVSATSTQIKFTVNGGCAGDDFITSLEEGDVTLKDAGGSAVTHSFVAADANGVYTLTGTGFANGLLIDLDGVVSQTEASYESTGPATVTGIS
ncbi:hypothetical protein [Flavobacterium sp. UMI-01]|uniref:hypothetical protein n=1 Tax=Flavobacterium sp. UMI-01 TaxID=1441053 RepID=UPI001C7DE226|nr:hypothetical protein [Flavobacterium sp. UMI-01]GIZ08375.1 hypothetical protein FUMI01_11020 [Flavobacterium sp. UMI-01]